MVQKQIDLPLQEKTILTVRAGERVLLSGTVYTARDAAHKRMIKQLQNNEQLPFDVNGQVIYYVGPTPAKPGQVIGSAGPTTSSRMDKYTPPLLNLGLKGMIGKGYRSEEVKRALIKNKAIYFGAIGGAAALISRSIKAVKVIAYEDLGTEAIHKLTLHQFPAVVLQDAFGGDQYEIGTKAFRELN